MRIVTLHVAVLQREASTAVCNATGKSAGGPLQQFWRRDPKSAGQAGDFTPAPTNLLSRKCLPPAQAAALKRCSASAVPCPSLLGASAPDARNIFHSESSRPASSKPEPAGATRKQSEGGCINKQRRPLFDADGISIQR
ncbi:hypothetical protein PF005_g16781 [Phytophthora fragariae]|uniref:Uncharacterized protein n=1 Tax=Phytophthora fragariae TaxID=53985 RepID=A0A6A3RHB0_9STRA|nr:hypothetical protein PF003_g18913 [Phytophthora fragariae]KAE8931883.1 hypothetical protein PF009_g18071 [Phytophthora fragariae]KAE9009316.1 hypothetical protein PF011_g10324 [Phytophthora fragariae]KAE9096428.1 hypothetical protein PF007_g17006 [Phytophthora fragariae]KAE9096534.1 hypothetical protein PF010_g16312 [Phytophthora fragariae]